MTSRETAKRREPEPLKTATDIPIACIPGVFTKEERVAQMAISIDAISRWPLRRQELPDGYLFEYEGTEDRFLELARWASGEHRCCPWASYSIEMAPFGGAAPGTIRVRVRAPEEGVAFLRACYAYVEKLEGGAPPDSRFNADRTEPITPGEVQGALERCGGC
jgi:hypothetical protein